MSKVSIQHVVKCDTCGETYRDHVANSVFYVVMHDRLEEFLAKHRYCCDRQKYPENFDAK